MNNTRSELNKTLEGKKLTVFPSRLSAYDYSMRARNPDEVMSTLVVPGFEITKDGNFINFNIKPEKLASLVLDLIATKDLIKKTEKKKKILIDFSSPNIAKELHVGHLRSTIIGDVLARMHEVYGNDVSRINHIGDFGLPFGMLLEHVISEGTEYKNITDLHKHYKNAKHRMDTDPEFKKKAYERTVDLQQQKEYALEIWKKICDVSREAFNELYDAFDVRLDEVGESFYYNRIQGMLDRVEKKGILVEDKGRKILDIGGDPPLTMVKSDGGYTYDTTDVTALEYRLTELGQDEVVYVVDKGQSQHFKLLFRAAKKMGWDINKKLTHIAFGVVQGEDGSRMKSRDGDSYPLRLLLEEAIKKTEGIIIEKFATSDTKLDAKDTESIKKITLTVIKFYELSHSFSSDYMFDFDKMVSFDGKTGVYLLYTLVRAKSILRKYHEVHDNLPEFTKFELTTPSGIILARRLVVFPEVFDDVIKSNKIHNICDYLYMLSTDFSKFVTKERVLNYDKDGVLIGFDTNNLCLTVAYIELTTRVFGLLGLFGIDKM